MIAFTREKDLNLLADDVNYALLSVSLADSGKGGRRVLRNRHPNA